MKPAFIHKALFILPMKNQYGVLEHFTLSLAEAMGRLGVECEVMPSLGGESQKLIKELVVNPPDFTCAFNGLLPDEAGSFLADRLEVPHMACLVDSSHHFLPMAKSEYSILGCDDRHSVTILKGIGAQNCFFLPHGVDKKLIGEIENERDIPVLMLGSNIDFESVREGWLARLPTDLAKAADLAAEMVLADGELSLIDAVVQALEKARDGEKLRQDPLTRLHCLELVEYVEQYVRGKARYDLISSIRDVPVAIYGGVYQGKGWSKFFGKNHPNVTVHKGVSFQEAVGLMRRSKIVLNNCPRIRSGAHERIFAGIACGGLPLTEENRYMRGAFTEGHDVAFYRQNRLNEVNDLVLHYLENEEARCAVVRAGQENVRRHHTWDVRAAQILEELGVRLPLIC